MMSGKLIGFRVGSFSRMLHRSVKEKGLKVAMLRMVSSLTGVLAFIATNKVDMF